MKRNNITRIERLQFSLPQNLKNILVGLVLGDLNILKQKTSVNVNLQFCQGTVHKEYLIHLYDLFQIYCGMAPKTIIRSPDKRTGISYSSIYFRTYALPCFNELYELFYINGIKIVPSNIFELLTVEGLCYWICDDGSFCKRYQVITLSTQSFTFADVELLIKVLNDKFGLKCTINKSGNASRIRISAESLPVMQSLLSPIMPSTMRHKIGL
jgi:hypothetical protein